MEFASAVYRETLWTPHEEAELERILESAFSGTALGGSFKLGATGRRNKNSWRPRLVGTYEPGDTGTLLHVSYPMHPFVFVFTLVHGIPFLGLSWLIGFAAWRWGVVEMSKELREVVSVGGVGVDAVKASEVEPADPTQPGAAAGAPGSLRPLVTMNGVSFGLGGEGDKKLVVDQVGLLLTWRERLLPWDDIARIDLDPLERLRIVTQAGETLRIGLQTAHEEDRLWLAVFLETRNQLGTGSDDERAAAAREQERLAALVQQPTENRGV